MSSVKADQARMKGTVRVTQAQSFEIHEITAEHGTVVREFVSPEGNVFGVAWKGQFIPDLQQLFRQLFRSVLGSSQSTESVVRGASTAECPTPRISRSNVRTHARILGPRISSRNAAARSSGRFHPLGGLCSEPVLPSHSGLSYFWLPAVEAAVPHLLRSSIGGSDAQYRANN